MQCTTQDSKSLISQKMKHLPKYCENNHSHPMYDFSQILVTEWQSLASPSVVGVLPANCKGYNGTPA